jgi:polysaccharide deacetylase family protein (PEP-CTERM system associated)
MVVEKQSGRIAPQSEVHVISVDVEDYFQVEAFSADIPRGSWDLYPLRVEDNTRRILDLFDENETKATFFVLGWIADRCPQLVREIYHRGHEIACHSYWHRCIYSLTPEEFREDTRLAKEALEQAAGTRIIGYRAPNWSITSKSLWGLQVLAEEGFEYDSSIYPIHHDIYGIPGARSAPYTHVLNGNFRLQEFPPATVRILGMTIPAAGGGYLRILPFAYTAWACRKISANQRLMVYLHPWEIDPKQPRVPSRLRSRFRHYTNLTKMENRLQQLLKLYRFASFEKVLRNSLANVVEAVPLRVTGVHA